MISTEMPNAHQDKLRREKAVLEITDDLMALVRKYIKLEARATMSLQEYIAELSADIPAYQRRSIARLCKRQAEAIFQPVKDRFYVEVPTSEGRECVRALAQKETD